MTRCETNLHVIASEQGAMSLCKGLGRYLTRKPPPGVNYMASVARSFISSEIITSQLQGEFGVCEAVATASLEFVLVLASFGVGAISGTLWMIRQSRVFLDVSNRTISLQDSPCQREKHSRLKLT